MRSVLAVFIAVVVILIGIPALVVASFDRLQPPVASEPAVNPTIRLYLSASGQTVELALEDYVKGVVAAEMPAEFESEALQAQAVAARTYVVKRARAFGGKGCAAHPEADVCDSPAHCQAWSATAELQKRWGMIDFLTHWQRIEAAVTATAGEIITFQGVAIDPLFHSTCGGKTESAANLWKQALPYLTSVTCPYCLESPKFLTDQRFALTDFLAAVRQQDDAITVTAQQIHGGKPALTIASTTSTGRVETVNIGGRELTAISLRGLLGLNSTQFNCELERDQLVFHVRGYGHGVGLCQYGANGMAKAGKNFRQIIAYYYQGSAISRLR